MIEDLALKTEALAEGFHLLEGPRWHEGRLWVSDIFGHKLHRIGLDGEVESLAEVPGRPSGLGFLPDGRPLIASMTDRRLLRLEEGELQLHADLSGLVSGDLNDMVMDAAGRAFVGNLGFDVWNGAPYRSANLVMVGPDGTARVVAEEMAVPNGSVILPDSATLVVAETKAHRLTAFTIAADGGLFDRRLFADLGPYGPDGICLDQEGAIWIGAFDEEVFLRIREGGEITHRIPVTGRRAVACQLGGPEGRDLFCLTCEGGWDEIRGGRGRARVELAKVEVPGAGSP